MDQRLGHQPDPQLHPDPHWRYHPGLDGSSGSGSSALPAPTGLGVTATTASSASQCFTASSYAQAAGRAYQSGGYAYANGSGQSMGLDNVYYSHTLEETAAGYT